MPPLTPRTYVTTQHPPLHGRRLLLCWLAVALPLVVLMGSAVWLHHSANRAAAGESLVNQARGMARILDREFSEAERQLRLLADSPLLRRGELNEFRLEMQGAARVTGALAIDLIGPNKKLLRSTAQPANASPSHLVTDAALGALATGTVLFSNPVYSPTFGGPVVSVTIAYDLDMPGGPVRHWLGYRLSPERLLEAMRSQPLPAGGFASVRDRDLMLVAPARQDSLTIGAPVDPQIPAMASAEGIIHGAGQAGQQLVTAYALAPLSGYQASLSVPESAFLAPLRTALLRALSLAALFLVLSLALMRLFARRIAVSLGIAPAGDSALALLHSILDTTTDRVSVLDSDGRFLFINRAGLNFMGAGDLAGLSEKHWREIWPADQIEMIEQTIAAAAAGHPGRFSGMTETPQAGELWWDVVITPIPPTKAAAARVLVVARDFTSGHAVRDVLQQANLRLEASVAERTRTLNDTANELAAELKRREETQSALLQAQKLEALGQLTSGVAHDFNNMLAAIQGSYTLLAKRAHDDVSQKVIRSGRQASERAAALIRHLLAFARREELHPVLVDPATLVPGIAELVRQAVGRKISVKLHPVPVDIWRILLEPHQLEVAVLNLAVNARDAMPDGGVLTLTIHNLMVAEGTLPGLAAGDYVAFDIQDTGTGMAPEVLTRATEAFFTTKEVGKGTGLGLAMVQGLASQLGGMLHIQSTLGVGTTMSIILPRAAIQAQALAIEPPVDITQHGNAAILLVEDDEQVRVVIAGFLRDLNYKVIEAGSADAGYVMALASDRIDLVVSDVTMPGGDGPSMAARLRQKWPDLPIIFVTGFAGNAALDGETVLAKPYEFAHLSRLITDRLRQRTAIAKPTWDIDS